MPEPDAPRPDAGPADGYEVYRPPTEERPERTSRAGAVATVACLALGGAAGLWLGGPSDPEPTRREPPTYTDRAAWERCVRDQRSAADAHPVLTPEEVCSVSYPEYDGPGSVDPLDGSFGPGEDEPGFP